MDGKSLSNAPGKIDPTRTFKITYPFHPSWGKEYALVAYRNSWGEDRVFFHDEHGQLSSLSASWTDVVDTDPFLKISAGRAYFRVQELQQLVQLINALKDHTPLDQEDRKEP